PPLMLQTDANPGGLPKSVFDGWQEQVATNRTGFYRDLPTGPFYGYNRPRVGQAGQERDPEDLPRLPARHAHHARRDHQRRPAGLAAAVASTTARSAEIIH